MTYPLRITIIQWDWKNSVLYLHRCLERKQNLYINTWVINFLGNINVLLINMHDFCENMVLHFFGDLVT